MNSKAIIIDSGSSSVKAGISGDDVPLTVFPNIGNISQIEYSSRHTRPKSFDFHNSSSSLSSGGGGQHHASFHSNNQVFASDFYFFI